MQRVGNPRSRDRDTARDTGPAQGEPQHEPDAPVSAEPVDRDSAALLPRDLVGYAGTPPDFCWPGGARIAVNFVLNYEEGAERSPLEGDTDREWLVEATYVVPPGERELYLESTFEYGSRVGVWRVLDLLDHYGVAPTVFACGQALERNVPVARAFNERGCDYVGHGYRWLPPTGLGLEQERKEIRRGRDAIHAVTGQPVRGWFWRPSNTVRTRQILAEEGFLYDSFAMNDDLPYFQPVAGRPFLIVPYSLDVNDARFHKAEFVVGRDFSTYAIDAFEALVSDGTPAMMSIGLHCRIIGRPARIGALERVLAHVAGRDEVWIASRTQIAEFWMANFGPEDAWGASRAVGASG
jgi:peptidoglycan/xylan/chitin deacetylase (PgdA/CDA1 family)